MSTFNYCYKILQISDTSHAWIALHRCIEAYARTTGRTFNSVFEEYEARYNFDRKVPERWPDLNKIKLIGKSLKEERDQYIKSLNEMIMKRRDEKRQGIRNSEDKNFLSIVHRQTSNHKKKMPPWGWKKKRENTD